MKKQPALLSAQLDGAYRDTLAGLNENTALLLHPKNENRNFTLSPFDRLEKPESLIQLKNEVSARLPRVDLPEVLLEIHALTGFANEFTHLSEENVRAEDLVISLCATLMAQACNTGLEPVIDASFLPLTRHRLSWTMQNYFRAETLIAANARLVNFQTTIAAGKTLGWRRSGIGRWNEVCGAGTDNPCWAEPKIFSWPWRDPLQFGAVVYKEIICMIWGAMKKS